MCLSDIDSVTQPDVSLLSPAHVWMFFYVLICFYSPYSSLWVITFDPVFRTLCRNSPTCWVWVQAWRSRTLWTLRNTETPLLSWDVWQRNWLVHRSCFLSESKCPTVVVLLSNSFCFPGPASIGLLSPGTLEYLLESLVSRVKPNNIDEIFFFLMSRQADVCLILTTSVL